MEIKNWMNLKDFANSLTTEQLEQTVFIYPEDSGRIKVSSVSIENEAFYWEVGNEVDGCFLLSDLDKDDIYEMNLKEAIPAGSILLDVEFIE